MFGLGPLVTLGIYAAIAIAAAVFITTAWSGFKESIAAPYVQKQIEKGAKELAGERTLRLVAQQDATTAKGNETSCKDSLKVQKDATKEMEDLAKVRLAESRRQKAENDKLQATMVPRIAELQAKAAAAPKLVTCEADLAEARKGLTDIIERRSGRTK